MLENICVFHGEKQNIFEWILIYQACIGSLWENFILLFNTFLIKLTI